MSARTEYAANPGANTNISSMTPASGSLVISTGSGANTANINLGTTAGFMRVTAQGINFRAAPTTGGNGLVFQDSSGTSVAQVYNIVGSATYLDFDTLLNIRAGYGGGSVITVSSARTTLANVLSLKAYTVATLPSGTVGDMAYVTDASGPTYNATVVGGGAVKIPVFYNGTNWTCH